MNCDLLIINGMVKTHAAVDPNPANPGFVIIKAGKISSTGPMSELPPNIEPARTINADNCLVMPGLVNGHAHSPMTLFRGLADDLPLMVWLQEHIFPAEAKYVTPEMVYWCSKLAAAEMVLSGTTTVADSYFFVGEAARAMKEVGIRCVAAQGVIDFPAPGVPDPARNIDVASQFIHAWQNEDLITPGIFCHSPYTCGAQTITKAHELARQTDSLFFIHLAETSAEREQSIKDHSLSPIRYLEKIGALDEKTVCVHCIWLDDEDILVLRESGASMASCPESNMKLASGIAPLEKVVTAGIPVALGTDSSASNNNLDMFGELATAAKVHKASTLDPTVLPAEKIIEIATTGGSEVLGLQDKCGRLKNGMQADIIIIDLNKPHLTPMYESNSLLTYAAAGSDVKMTIIAGKIILEDGLIQTINLQETILKVNEMAAKVRSTI